MFRTKRAEPLIGSPPTSPERSLPRMPTAHAVSAPLEDNELRAYHRTAQAIGFEPAALLQARVLALFAAQQIPVYPYQAVVDYMTAKVSPLGEAYRWWWRPLREVDRASDWQWNSGVGDWHWVGEAQCWRNDSYSNARWECRPYHRAVPLRVLARVETIAGVFAERLKFFVTDYGQAQRHSAALHTRPDPFICVRALDMDPLVFDFWDEPGFQG